MAITKNSSDLYPYSASQNSHNFNKISSILEALILQSTLNIFTTSSIAYMGRQNSEAAIAGPSIALLQERFRKLQRVREKREERQLLDLFSEPKRIASSKGNNQQSGSNFYFSHEMILPSRLHFQDPLSLGLNLNSNHTDYRDIRSQPLRFADTRGVKAPNTFDISDVDTSLHL